MHVTQLEEDERDYESIERWKTKGSLRKEWMKEKKRKELKPVISWESKTECVRRRKQFGAG